MLVDLHARRVMPSFPALDPGNDRRLIELELHPERALPGGLVCDLLGGLLAVGVQLGVLLTLPLERSLGLLQRGATRLRSLQLLRQLIATSVAV
jgi:hypothetical protein